MYNFIDVNETSGGIAIPSEALKLNGEYIENQVEGYQTLYVQGREMLSPIIDSYETGIKDGSIFKNKRYPARTITVGYQLITKNNVDFRSAFNKLNSILNTENAQLIFADESDKYFIGTPSNMADVSTGKNAITSEIEFTCFDPFKYSVEEFEITPNLDNATTFALNYQGTYKTFPILEAKFPEAIKNDDGTVVAEGDCGFVSFFNDREKVIQIGNVDVMDYLEYPQSQLLISDPLTSWDADTQSKWAVNTGFETPTVFHMGTVDTVADEWGNTLLSGKSFGSGNVYHGPSITRSIPADKAGHIGAKNFKFTWEQRLAMSANTNKQYGCFQALLVNNNNGVRKIVAGIGIYKNSANNTADWYYYVNSDTGYAVKQYRNIDITRLNRYFGYAHTSVLYSGISKSGGVITFNIGGIKRTFTDARITDTEVNEISFVIGQLGNYPVFRSNGLFKCHFTKDDCDTFEDIPNKFTSGDVATIDCESGDIKINGSPAPELGALGNQFEDFSLMPGDNSIKTAFSDWCINRPTFKLKYRERFL